MSNGPTITIVGDFADLPAASYQALARLLLAMSEPDTPPTHQPGHAEARAVPESMPDAEPDTRSPRLRRGAKK